MSIKSVLLCFCDFTRARTKLNFKMSVRQHKHFKMGAVRYARALFIISGKISKNSRKLWTKFLFLI